MNARQRKFCEFYAECGNAAEAARKAGYSERAARRQAARLLSNVDVQGYIAELRDKSASARIASIAQIRAFWSDVLNDPNAKTADRLRAGELLARSSGAFLSVFTKPKEGERVAGVRDDVIIYLPEIPSLEEYEVQEDGQD